MAMPRGVTRSAHLEVLLAHVGLYVATWAPGDGVTRYRFFVTPSDYNSSDGLYTALGHKEAITFVQGVAVGRRLHFLGRR